MLFNALKVVCLDQREFLRRKKGSFSIMMTLETQNLDQWAFHEVKKVVHNPFQVVFLDQRAFLKRKKGSLSIMVTLQTQNLDQWASHQVKKVFHKALIVVYLDQRALLERKKGSKSIVVTIQTQNMDQWAFHENKKSVLCRFKSNLSRLEGICRKEKRQAQPERRLEGIWYEKNQPSGPSGHFIR